MNPFWGWSSLAYIMPLEYVTRYDATDLDELVKPLVRTDLRIASP
jgi:hypothetical protein